MAEAMIASTKNTISEYSDQLGFTVSYTKKRDRKWSSKNLGSDNSSSESDSEEEIIPHELKLKFANELMQLPKDAMTKVVK